MTPKELNQKVHALQQGNMSVFDDIYDETKSLVFYTIHQIIQDRFLAEDIMQETYLNALEHIHDFKPRYSFTSWVVRIARNLAINEYNRRKREFHVDATEQAYLFGTSESSSEKELIVQEMIESLKPIEQEVLILHVVGDLKHREIATILQKPIGTITWTYQQAIQKINNQFGEKVRQ